MEDGVLETTGDCKVGIDRLHASWDMLISSNRDLQIYDVNFYDEYFETKEFFTQNKRDE